MKHYTYWILDHVNGMYYHGVHSSDQPEDIQAYHGSCKALNEAIRRHGIENFSKRIERVHETRELANSWEERVHRRLNVADHPLFYNSINARPFLGAKPGPLSDKHMRRLFSPESRTKMAEAKLGRAFPKDEAWKKKVSEAKKGKPLSEAHRAALKGVAKSLTDEQRDAMRRRSADKAGTGSHNRCLGSDGYVLIKIENPSETYFVLNANAFGREMLRVNHSLSSKLKAIIDGKRREVSGYTARRPTAEELRDIRPQLVESGLPYVAMSEA
jgi:hypothetical protein